MDNSNSISQPVTKRLRQSNIEGFFKLKNSTNSEKYDGSISKKNPMEKKEEIKTTRDSCSKSAESFFTSREVGSSAEKKNSSLVLGTPLSKLRKMPHCVTSLPLLKPTPSHTVLFKVPLNPNEPPEPYPRTFTDRWDNDYVRMPCSSESLYPIESTRGEKKIENRWHLIQTSLSRPISSSLDLEEAIKTYNSRYSSKWDFTGLHLFFTEVLDPTECEEFFKQLLPDMIDLTLQLPTLCTQPIPLLRCQKTHSTTISQKQIACLLANAFFCTFPRRNNISRKSEYCRFPSINFNMLFAVSKRNDQQNRKFEKLRCLLHYFRRITKIEPLGTVTFTRQNLKSFPDWNSSKKVFNHLLVVEEGKIEDEGFGMLQVDFADKLIGGGVLNRGCVQEEIRFVICPELILSRLFTECIDNNECLIITGCERFCNYTGYADTFKFAGNYEDLTTKDSWGRRFTQVLAIDATYFRKTEDQFHPKWLLRELNKAFCGFYMPGVSNQQLPAIASGNWGCGVFKGNAQLKSLLQLMAAGETGREFVYFSFGNEKLCNELHSMHTFLIGHHVTIGTIWKLLEQYFLLHGQHGKPKLSVFEFIKSNLVLYGSDTESNSGSSSRGSKKFFQSDPTAKAENSGSEMDTATCSKITISKDIEEFKIDEDSDQEEWITQLKNQWTETQEEMKKE